MTLAFAANICSCLLALYSFFLAFAGCVAGGTVRGPDVAAGSACFRTAGWQQTGLLPAQLARRPGLAAERAPRPQRRGYYSCAATSFAIFSRRGGSAQFCLCLSLQHVADGHTFRRGSLRP